MLILVIWSAYELTRRWRYVVLALSVVGGAAVVLCLALTRQQLGYWKDSETLFQHVLEVTENNSVAHNDLGAALERKGQTDEAIRQYQEALRLEPEYSLFHNNLGIALDKKGQTDEAIRQLQEALRLKPDYAEAHYSLGYVLDKKGQTGQGDSPLPGSPPPETGLRRGPPQPWLSPLPRKANLTRPSANSRKPSA